MRSDQTRSMMKLKCLMWLVAFAVFCYIFVLLFRTTAVSRLPYIKMVQGKLRETFYSISHTKKEDRPEVVSRIVVLNAGEDANVKACIDTKDKEFAEATRTFWPGNTADIRYTSHSYLTNHSIVIDVGGNVGTDAQEFMKRYNSRLVIFEPLQPYYLKLKEKFAGSAKVKILDIGLGNKDEDTVMEIAGKDGDGSSLYRGNSPSKGELVKIKNTTRVLEEIGLGALSVDLLHIDCEGCELDILEALAHTNIIFHLKHIQFATHTQYAGVLDLVQRYCKMQEILKRTHNQMYQYKFVWESWVLK